MTRKSIFLAAFILASLSIIPHSLSAQKTPSQLKAVNQLVSSAPNARVRWESGYNSPAYISGVKLCMPGFSKASFTGAANYFLQSNKDAFGIDHSSSNFRISHVNKYEGMATVWFRQFHQGHEIYDAQYRIQLDSERCVRAASGKYYDNVIAPPVPSHSIEALAALLSNEVNAAVDADKIILDKLVLMFTNQEFHWAYVLSGAGYTFLYDDTLGELIATRSTGAMHVDFDPSSLSSLTSSSKGIETVIDLKPPRTTKNANVYDTNPTAGPVVVRQLQDLVGTGSELSGHFVFPRESEDDSIVDISVYNAAFNPLNLLSGSGTPTAIDPVNEYKFTQEITSSSTCGGISNAPVGIDCSHFDDANTYYHLRDYINGYWLRYLTTQVVQVETLERGADKDLGNAWIKVAPASANPVIQFTSGSDPGKPLFKDPAKINTVIAHEYNHLVFRQFGFQANGNINAAGAIDEGLADFFAANYYGSPEIGEGWRWCPPGLIEPDSPCPTQGATAGIRSLASTFSAPNPMVPVLSWTVQYSPCSYQINDQGGISCLTVSHTPQASEHAAGMVLGSALWDMRQVWPTLTQGLVRFTLLNLAGDDDFLDFAEKFRDTAELFSFMTDPSGNPFTPARAGWYLENRNFFENPVPRPTTPPSMSISNPGIVGNVLEATSLRDTTLPEEFAIVEVYPNPFNPQTTIKMSFRESGNYQLEVFDALGRRVAELLNGHVEEGTHSVTFKPANLSSGIYTYRLSGASGIVTGRLVQLK